MLTLGRALDRDRLKLIVAVLCAVPCGIAVGLRPTTVLLLASVGVGLSACLLIPIRHLPTLVLAITIVMPSLVFESVGGSGQARAIVVVLVLALGRVVMTRSRIDVPGILPLAIGAALGLTLMTALVATARPATEVGGNSDLVRDLSFPAAAVIGFFGATSARGEGNPLAVARAFAWVGVVAALLSAWYWAWHKLGIPPLSASLFNQVSTASGFGSSRSIFPFVEDSPDIAAVMFVLFTAFAGPPLLLAATPRDRALGLLLVVASLAAVLTTQSRTGIFAAGGAAAIYLLLVKRGGGRRSTALAVLILLCSAGAFVFATFPAERASGDTLNARVQIWGQAERAFLDDPIIGHGYEYSLKGNFVEGYSLGTVSHYQSTHSDLMSELVDGGVLGTAVFIAVLVLMAVVAYRAVQDPSMRAFGIGYSCFLIALVVGGIDNTLSQSAAVVTLEWITFGLMVGLCPAALWGARRYGS